MDAQTNGTSFNEWILNNAHITNQDVNKYFYVFLYIFMV